MSGKHSSCAASWNTPSCGGCILLLSAFVLPLKPAGLPPVTLLLLLLLLLPVAIVLLVLLVLLTVALLLLLAAALLLLLGVGPM